MPPPLVSDVVRFTLDLMGVESTSGNETGVMDLAQGLLESRGWSCTRIPVSEGRSNLLATTSEDFDLTLSTHLDTVPPFIAPTWDGAVIHGRGACDAKGIAASMMVAAERLREDGVRVALLFLVGEETNHDGAKAANAWIRKHRPVAPRVLINGEPTENRLGVGTKGTLRVTIRMQGVAAHSAYPEMGRSATHDLVRLLSELDAQNWPTDPILGETTVNIGSLSGGTADNVFAPKASARLMFRLVSDAEIVKQHVIAWVGDRATLEWGVSVPPVHLATMEGFASDVVAYATDIPMLPNWGTPYLYGPGSIHVAHTDGELVRASDLDLAIDDYVRLGRQALRAL